MAESENAAVNVEMSGVESRLDRLSDSIGRLESETERIGESVKAGFDKNESKLEELDIGLDDICEDVEIAGSDVITALKDGFGELIAETTKLKNLLDNLIKQQGEQGRVDLALKAFEIVGEFTKYSNQNKRENTNTERPLLPAPRNSDNSSNNVTSSIMGNLGGEVAFGMPTDTLVAGMDIVIGKIEQMTLGWKNEANAKNGSVLASWVLNATTTAWQAICTAATAVTTAFGAAMSFLTSPIGVVIVAITAIIAIIVLLVKNWDTVSAKAQEVWTFVQNKFSEFSAFLENVFAKDWTEQFGVFGNILNVFFANVQNIWNSVKTIFNGVISFVKSVFAGDWETAWDSVKQIFEGIWQGLLAALKGPVNGIIGFINGMVSGIVRGVNAIIGVLNKLKFSIPEWVPGYGGKMFGFNIPTISAPSIPYLAQGAVLPANRPFLAMVGDQRHGTNVEAPLATIQEAVALVMNDQIGAMMAGFQALLEEQQATRIAVENIHVGDDAIAAAVDRHRVRRAMMCGY